MAAAWTLLWEPKRVWSYFRPTVLPESTKEPADVCRRETVTGTAAFTFTLYPGLGQTLPTHDLLCPIRTG